MKGQIPPVGPPPNVSVLFLGALFFADPDAAREVLHQVRDDDMPTSSTTVVLEAVRRLIDAGKPASPQLVLDRMQREGNLKRFACRDIQDAATSGAQPMALRDYAAAVVAAAFRRRIDGAGHALTAAASAASECDLTALVSGATRSALDCADRLAVLRGEDA